MGYLDALGMPGQSFNETLHDYFTYTYQGWVDLIIFIMSILSPSSLISYAKSNFFLASITWIVLLIPTGLFLFSKEIEEHIKNKELDFRKKDKAKLNKYKTIFKTASLIIAPAYAIFAIPLFIAVIIGLPIEPFKYLGYQQALKALENPAYELTVFVDDSTTPAQLDAIECRLEYCLAKHGNHIKVIRSGMIISQKTRFATK